MPNLTPAQAAAYLSQTEQVGDVVPLPILPGPNAGQPRPGGTLADMRGGPGPNLALMPPNIFDEFYKRSLSRLLSKPLYGK